jgi:hypothetical protein
VSITKETKHNITNKATSNLKKRVAIEISLNVKQKNITIITKNPRPKIKES